MVSFYETFGDFEIVHILSAQLTWSHIKELIAFEDNLKREFYATMCKAERWSVRTLRERIASRLYERTAISKKPEETIVNDLKLLYHRKMRRLVAIELKLDKFKPEHTGQVELYLRWLNKHERNDGEEAPIGLILCAKKSQETVELLELDKSGIHVAQYITQLPPKEIFEEKLHKAILKARLQLEQRRNDN